MSFKYYVNWWIKNKKELEELEKINKEFLTKAGDVKERSIANKLVGGLYARYCMLVQELDLCLDQLAQPQKNCCYQEIGRICCDAFERTFQRTQMDRLLRIPLY